MACPRLIAPAGLSLPAGLRQRPPRGDGPSLMVPLTGRLVLPDPLWSGCPAPGWRCPGVLAPGCPGAAVLGAPLATVPIRLVGGDVGFCPSAWGAAPPLFPLVGMSLGGSVRGLCAGAWCQSVGPLGVSISAPGAVRVSPGRGQWPCLPPSQALGGLIGVWSSGAVPWWWMGVGAALVLSSGPRGDACMLRSERIILIADRRPPPRQDTWIL